MNGVDFPLLVLAGADGEEGGVTVGGRGSGGVKEKGSGGGGGEFLGSRQRCQSIRPDAVCG